jgi:hypothetical protein
MNKKFILSGMLVCALTFGLVLVSCAGDDGGGGRSLPNNLKNTTWTYASNPYGSPLKFFETTLEMPSGTGYGVFSATENGQITVKMGDEDVWKYMDEDVFWDSYTISEDGKTLTIVASEDTVMDDWNKTWTLVEEE